MNAVAEELTGWTLLDASMKPVPEVFNIINEQTRREVENPVTKVLREGMIVGLANHTILVRKDGTEVPIDDSGAPIRDAEGKTVGVVLVFRDIAERKRAEERTEHLASYPRLNPRPIIEVDVSGTITFANPSSQAILEKLGLDKGDFKALLPHDLDAILRDWDKENEITLDREVILADRVLDETVQLVPQFKAVRIYARDITKRKRAEEALQKAHDELEQRVQERTEALRLASAYNRKLIEAALDPLVTIDPEGRISDVNAATELATGYSRAELIGTDFSDYFTDPEKARSGYRQVFSKGFVRDYELDIRHRNGQITPVLYNASVYRDEAGEVVGVFAAARDMTEHTRMEEELRESEQHYRTLFNAIDEGFCTVEVIFDENQKPIDYRFLEVNAAFEKQTGLIDAQGKSMRELAPNHEEHWFETYGKIALTGQPARFQNYAEQLHRWYDVYAFRVGQPENRHVAILFSDITEQMRLDEQLRQSQKMEAIGTLAGGIAHDFNNMLAAIIGNAELAMDDVPEEMTARHNLDQIFKAGMRARGLVRQILTFSRKTEQEHKPLSLRPLINETFKLLRSSLPTIIEMRLNIDTLSDVVLADPVQIQQILMNLCTNAGDAMRHAGGRLEVSLTDTVFSEGDTLPEADIQPGTYVTLTVSDTGPRHT